MEGILLLLSPLILIALVLGVGAGLTYLFTGMTPKEYAYNKEVKRREDEMRRGATDVRINLEAARRLQQEGRL